MFKKKDQYICRKNIDKIVKNFLNICLRITHFLSIFFKGSKIIFFWIKTWIFLKGSKESFKSGSGNIESGSVCFRRMMNYRILSTVQGHPIKNFINFEKKIQNFPENMIFKSHHIHFLGKKWKKNYTEKKLGLLWF